MNRKQRKLLLKQLSSKSSKANDIQLAAEKTIQNLLKKLGQPAPQLSFEMEDEPVSEVRPKLTLVPQETANRLSPRVQNMLASVVEEVVENILTNIESKFPDATKN